MIPFDRVLSYPYGAPIVDATSPIPIFEESANARDFRSVAPSMWITARSLSSSIPRSAAEYSLSPTFTMMSEYPLTMWALVRMSPLPLMTTPDPIPLMTVLVLFSSADGSYPKMPNPYDEVA